MTGSAAVMEFLTTLEAAKLLRVAKSTLERMRVQGTGPAIHQGGTRQTVAGALSARRDQRLAGEAELRVDVGVPALKRLVWYIWSNVHLCT